MLTQKFKAQAKDSSNNGYQGGTGYDDSQMPGQTSTSTSGGGGGGTAAPHNIAQYGYNHLLEGMVTGQGFATHNQNDVEDVKQVAAANPNSDVAEVFTQEGWDGSYTPYQPPTFEVTEEPPPSAPVSEEEPIDFQGRFDDMWGQVMADHEGRLGDMLEGTYADEAAAGRRNAEMNALAGGGVGGAFAGGQAQVALGGMQQRLKVRQEWAKQGLEMKMTYLQHMLRQAEAEKDRDLQQWLQSEADKTALEIAGMQSEQATADREAQADAMDAANKVAEAEANDSNWVESLFNHDFNGDNVSGTDWNPFW